eukprot:525997-Pyramimonas_sp.AAC.1
MRHRSAAFLGQECARVCPRRKRAFTDYHHPIASETWHSDIQNSGSAVGEGSNAAALGNKSRTSSGLSDGLRLMVQIHALLRVGVDGCLAARQEAGSGAEEKDIEGIAKKGLRMNPRIDNWMEETELKSMEEERSETPMHERGGADGAGGESLRKIHFHPQRRPTPN